MERAPPAPTARKKAGKGEGGGGSRFTARNLAADYLELCHNPLKDLRRWLAEDKKLSRAPPVTSLTKKGGAYAHSEGTATFVAEAERLRREPLPPMRGGMDAGGSGGGANGVSIGPRAGAGGDDGLRQVREERSGQLARSADGDAGGSYAAEAEAINALFTEKLEGLRRRLPKWEIPAAVRALKDERQARLQGISDRRHAESITEREITRRERTGIPPTARPA